MDLIYTDKNWTDIGIMNDYEIDIEIGNENDFQITTSIENNVIPVGGYFYFENSEYGGKITTLEVDTSKKRLYYGGRTFYGMLCDKIICPESGEDYYKVNGEANEIIWNVINKLEMSGLFSVSREVTEFNFVNYKFDRYIDCYTGISKMLRTKNAKLKLSLKEKRIELRAVRIDDYSNEEFSSDMVNFIIKQNKTPINHLICLGKGELSERQVLNLYADKNGEISRTQYYTGVDEVAATYDYSNVESEEELLKAGTEKLLEYQESDNIDITIENAEKDVRDIIEGEEVVTGLRIRGEVTKKIIKIQNNENPKFTYEVGQIVTT